MLRFQATWIPEPPGPRGLTGLWLPLVGTRDPLWSRGGEIQQFDSANHHTEEHSITLFAERSEHRGPCSAEKHTARTHSGKAGERESVRFKDDNKNRWKTITVHVGASDAAGHRRTFSNNKISGLSASDF